jgi:hypothetical protein
MIWIQPSLHSSACSHCAGKSGFVHSEQSVAKVAEAVATVA